MLSPRLGQNLKLFDWSWDEPISVLCWIDTDVISKGIVERFTTWRTIIHSKIELTDDSLNFLLHEK